MSLNIQGKFQTVFGVAAAPALKALAIDELNKAQDPRKELFSMESMDREIKQWSKLSTLGQMEQISEAELAPADSFAQLGTKTFTAYKFAKSIGISEEMVDDQQFDMISRMARSLGNSAIETQLVSAFNVINNSFTSETGFDGVAILSTAHPSLVGNQSNKIATPADISYAGLQEMEQSFRKLQDERGKKLIMEPKIVLVSESFRHDALALVNSPFKPGSANNDVNVLSGLKVISSPYLTDDDAWFGLADPSKHGLKIYDRKPLETKLHEDVLAGVLYYKAQYRQAVGCDEWRGIWGSVGA